jgi:hypothetical protein
VELLVDKEINETFCQLLKKKAVDILIEKKNAISNTRIYFTLFKLDK